MQIDFKGGRLKGGDRRGRETSQGLFDAGVRVLGRRQHQCDCAESWSEPIVVSYLNITRTKTIQSLYIKKKEEI